MYSTIKDVLSGAIFCVAKEVGAMLAISDS